MRSRKVSGPNLPTSSRCPGDSIWKQPRVWVGADQPERRLVVVRHASSSIRPSVEVEPAPRAPSTRRPGDLVDGVRHRRLHPDPEDVELEQPHLPRRRPCRTGSSGTPSQLASTGVRSSSAASEMQHAAGVQRDVAGQAVEPLDEVEEHGEPLGARSREARSSGSSREGVPHVTGADVREGLGDDVDLAGRHAQRGTDVADRVPHPVGVHHRDAGDPLGAEALRGSPRTPRCAGPTRRRGRCRAARSAAG